MLLLPSRARPGAGAFYRLDNDCIVGSFPVELLRRACRVQWCGGGCWPGGAMMAHPCRAATTERGWCSYGAMCHGLTSGRWARCGTPFFPVLWRSGAEAGGGSQVHVHWIVQSNVRSSTVTRRHWFVQSKFGVRGRTVGNALLTLLARCSCRGGRPPVVSCQACACAWRVRPSPDACLRRQALEQSNDHDTNVENAFPTFCCTKRRPYPRVDSSTMPTDAQCVAP